ncbi:meiotically up-regulated gene 113-domain-containing protein [Phaeosphaeria sp. MPI-PUGE-AT-0046c]|nr:meiotically up-regulated gene 113-domain-containing protein [Phaeosphaeria sp. MPI-PUGE-AT-0046c]
MAFTGRTPEALIPRSDSRNPATTCKGITKSGRPCRRPIDAKASLDDGVLAVVSVVSDEAGEEEIGAAAYFCWQHKDQAESLAAQASSGPATQLYPLKDRNSIETLVERLGVLEVDESAPKSRRKRRDSRQRDNNRTSGPRPARKINRPPTWDNIEGPLISIPSDIMAAEKRRTRPPKPAPQRQKPSFWSSLCCGSADDDHVEVTARPLNKTTRADSETAQLLRYIPQTLSPQLTSTLLSELSKPISPHDDDGYIYIFWLTPDSSGPAPSSAASSLLAPPTRADQGRRTSDVLRQYSVKQQPGSSRQRSGNQFAGAKTIFLKIGRANNVHRRMNEWTRQCGYSLSLVRYYPYVPSTPSPTPSPQTSPANSRRQSYQNSGRRVSEGVRKVPHAHRVERLIHLELGDQRVMKNCDACGKTHKEWFEVDASREGVKRVDEVVKRWVDWAEKANE